MNRVKEIERINAKDLQLQLAADTVGNAGVWDVNKSWHAQYKDSAYVYVGGLADGLSEGDVTPLTEDDKTYAEETCLPLLKTWNKQYRVKYYHH